MRYVHTNIVAKDWEALMAFYISVFQCKLVPPIRDLSGEWLAKGTGVPNAKFKGGHLLLPGYGPDGPTLEIYQYENIEKQEPIQANKRGFGHLAFRVDDVNVATRHVLSAGGTKAGEIVQHQVEGVGRLTFIYVRDPEGNLIELQSWETQSPDV